MTKRFYIALKWKVVLAAIGVGSVLLPSADANAPVGNIPSAPSAAVSVEVSDSVGGELRETELSRARAARRSCNVLGRRDTRGEQERAQNGDRTWTQSHGCDVSEADQQKLLVLFALWRRLS